MKPSSKGVTQEAGCSLGPSRHLFDSLLSFVTSLGCSPIHKIFLEKGVPGYSYSS